MNRDPDVPSRRQLLAGMVGLTAFGAGFGPGSSARLTDTVRTSTRLRAGEVSLEVQCDGGSCPESSGDGTLFVPIEDLEPGTTGTERVSLSVIDNPVRIWLRTACPPVVDPLGEALLVRLSIDRTGDGVDPVRLFPRADSGGDSDPESDADSPDGASRGSLNDFRNALSDGVRLDDRFDDSCLTADDDVDLRFEYELPPEATWAGDLETTLALELYAEQCRHVPEDDVENPFDPSPCPELDCPAGDCVELGKLEVENDRLDPGVHDFDEVYEPFADDDHGYDLEVLRVTNKAERGGDETICADFRVRKDGVERDAPPICAVDIRGGPAPGPGNRGPNERRYELEPPSTRTRGKLCTEEVTVGTKGETVRPAISHLTVTVCPDGVETGGDRP